MEFSSILVIVITVIGFVSYLISKTKQKELEGKILEFKQKKIRDDLNKKIENIENQIKTKKDEYEKDRDSFNKLSSDDPNAG